MEFVEFVIRQIKKDTAYRAKMCRADNKNTRYIAYECLTSWCDILREEELLPYATIGAALARSKIKKNGCLTIAEAIDELYVQTGSKHCSEKAASKLRRLLACDSVEELCTILRNILRQVETLGLNYENLLAEIKRFSSYKEDVKTKWASNFYRRNSNQKEEENASNNV